ncbi:BTB domain-containing protein [Mycena venus]|uniref:BTB domain-containing protein n=1 Tax=Mycena venus TaxID=2733690 RepID=A0A8H6Y9L6_9AGAR|nr:BTB domain-containing protein [Mycena venus]
MKYPSLWFNDGDIVLSPNTGYRPELPSFLVHRHVLSTNSPVFAAIFKQPFAVQRNQIEDIQEIDVLQVKDPAEDLAVLLSCLYYLKLPFRRDQPTVNVDLGGLLRLCTKYQISDLAAKVVNQLKFEWPTSLSIWAEHETRIRKWGIAHADAPNGQIDGQYLDNRFPEPVSIIQLAREFNIPELLPAALYTLSLISPSANYDTFHTLGARLLPEYATQLSRGTRSARWSLLSPQDFLCLAKGQDHLRSNKTLTRVFEGIACSPNCSAGCDALLVALRELVEQTHDILGALTYLRLYITEPEKASKMNICANCEKGICNTIEALRLRIWRNLPWWFGVPEIEFHAIE